MRDIGDEVVAAVGRAAGRRARPDFCFLTPVNALDRVATGTGAGFLATWIYSIDPVKAKGFGFTLRARRRMRDINKNADALLQKV